MVVRVAGKKKTKMSPGRKTVSSPKKKSLRKKKRPRRGEKKNYCPNKLTPGGQVHPIDEISERDFLDGALVGAGLLKPEIVSQP